MAAVDHTPLRSSRWVDDSGRERRERRGKGRTSRGSGADEGKRGWAEDVSTVGSSRSTRRRKEQQMYSRSLPGTLRGREGSRREEDEEEEEGDGKRGERKGEGERQRGRQKSKSMGERRQKAKDVRSQRENSLPVDGEREGGREKRDKNKSSTIEVTQRPPFSFLMPLDNDDDGSGAESAHSFSEVSVSAASIAFLGTPPDPISPLEASGSSTKAPGPWLVPSPHKLSQVLEGKRLSQKKGGLWS